MTNPIGLMLPIRHGNRGYFNMSTDILSQIKNNFINLMMTIKGERINNPEFGCDIHKIIFEQNDDQIYEKARAAVELAVQRWMPYLELEEFNIVSSDTDIDKYTLRVYIKYRLTTAPNITDEVVLQI